MGRNLDAEQAEAPRSSKKEKKSKNDKKRKLAAEAEAEAAAAAAATATEEAVKSSKKKKRVENGPGAGGGGEAENGAAKAVAVTGKGSEDPKYAPLRSFSAAELPSQVLECCSAFARPSPIQAHAWPFLLDGRDFIGIAATGSGKTIAFGVPALMHIRKKVGGKSGKKKAVPRCLVLSPTRELAQQIADVLSEAGAPCGIKSVCLYGGTKKEPQVSALKSGVDIVIGTPGRMKDLIEMGVCCLNEVSFVDLRTYTTRKGRAQGRSSRSDRRSGASGRAAGARPDQWLIFQEIFTIYYLLVSFIFILNSRSLLLPLVWTDGHICCKPWDEEFKQ
ncbi:DEAD-box ATP-dependent RNA helicase 5-like isoform X1 [Miscanthus floridulus]|uniref:DEAD-box ATP-dependent RNA helicase 5-like isoform X1 n=1 Tax=Miscanthus floridulus TaxID=154761 RepID=UPI0034591A4F